MPQELTPDQKRWVPLLNQIGTEKDWYQQGPERVEYLQGALMDAVKELPMGSPEQAQAQDLLDRATNLLQTGGYGLP